MCWISQCHTACVRVCGREVPRGHGRRRIRCKECGGSIICTRGRLSCSREDLAAAGLRASWLRAGGRPAAVSRRPSAGPAPAGQSAAGGQMKKPQRRRLGAMELSTSG